MLWRERSWLARLAIAISVLAVVLALVTLLAAALPDGQGGQASYAAFFYSLFIALVAVCLWVLVAVRLGVRGLLRRE